MTPTPQQLSKDCVSSLWLAQHSSWWKEAQSNKPPKTPSDQSYAELHNRLGPHWAAVWPQELLEPATWVKGRAPGPAPDSLLHSYWQHPCCMPAACHN